MDNSSVIYEIEKILKHKKMTRNKMIYLVKWKGYDSSHNSWEPECNFVSYKIILDYHNERKQKTKSNAKAKASKKIGDQMNDADTRQSEKRQNNTKIVSSKDREYLFEGEIEERGLIPEKVLNVLHEKKDKKNLVAHIQFKNQTESAFVPASWANQHCPQLIIQLYESRIHWYRKKTNELVKANFSKNI